jgi:glycosyltransferase involved in cell wall biosynthesis
MSPENMTRTISIIMPVLNGERFIGEALESICRQTYKDFELLVIDDGSTDRTREIVLGFGARLDLKFVRHETNQGITPSINDGLRRTSGKFIAFLDHDDFWLPDFLETQLTYLTEHPDVGMVHSDFKTVDGDGKVLEHSVAQCRNRTRPSGFVFRHLFMQSMICGNTVMIRKECFERLGLWDERLRWADYHMWLRVSRHYKIDYVPKVLTAYRQHATQCTNGNTSRPADETPVAARTIERLLEDYPEIREELGATTVAHRTASFYFDLAYAWFVQDELVNTRLCLRRAIRLWPTNLRYLGLYSATLLGRSQLRVARDAWRRLRGGAELADGVRG